MCVLTFQNDGAANSVMKNQSQSHKKKGAKSVSKRVKESTSSAVLATAEFDAD
jgi:hypothetical protein